MKVLQVFLLTVFVSFATASEKSNWPEGSAMHAGLSQKEILEKKQSKASEIVLKIRSNLEEHSPYKGEHLSSVFGRHNESWGDYVASTCMTVGVMTGSGGSWPSYYALTCERNMIDRRLFNLTNTLQCIKRHVKNEQPYELPNCLYQSFTVEY
ncbi:MAG: hypothetical protein V7745_06360 [Pseudomonadales bacterium]